MNFGKLFLGVISMMMFCACQEESSETPNPPSPTPDETITKTFEFTLDHPDGFTATRLGVLLFYNDGTPVSDALIEVAPNEGELAGSYGFEAEVKTAKTVDRMLVVAPCNADLTLLSDQHAIGQMIHAVQQPGVDAYDANSDILAGMVSLDGEGTAAVALTSLTTPVKFVVQGLDEGEKLRSVQLTGTEAVSGLALIDWQKEPVVIGSFAAEQAWNSLTASWPEGQNATSPVCLLTIPTRLVSPGMRIVTDNRLISVTLPGEVSFANSDEQPVTVDLNSLADPEMPLEKALTFDFIKNDGTPAATLESDQFDLPGSAGETIYHFEAPQCSIESGIGLCLHGDPASPGTLTIPNIADQQVTRILLLMDTREAMETHALWLETFDGEAWNKIDGTDKSVSRESASQNGGYIEFEIPKTNVSAVGRFRIAKGVEGIPTYIRSMTLTYDEATCTYDPASLIAPGFDSGWRRYGSSSSPDNNYDQEAVLIIDKEVSHVDDCSGALRIGGIDCLNGWKPWQSWAYQDIEVEAGATYKISVCVKTENMPTTANVYLGLGYKDASNQWMKGWIPNNPNLTAYNHVTSPWVDTEKGTHDWIKLTAEETVPEGAVKMGNLQVRLDNVITAPDAYVWFDDIQVVKIN